MVKVDVSINKFCETVYKWENHFHPDNPEFMQIVYWIAWQKPDGRYSIGYKLQPGEKVHFVKFGSGVIDNALLNYYGGYL